MMINDYVLLIKGIKLSLLGLFAKIKVFDVLQAHEPLIMNAGTALESIPLLTYV